MENNNKVSMWKRILAFMIDFLIVAVLSGIVIYAMPHNEKYKETVENSSALKELLSSENYDSKEYMKLSTEMTYDSYKYGMLENGITILIMISYFACFTYFNHGQTIGKKIVKTQVLTVTDEEPGFLSSLGRSLIISRSFGDIITLLLVISMKKATFVKSYYYIDMVITVIWIACPIIAIWRQDGRGLHDLISGTKVLDKRKLPHEEEKVVEAKIEAKEEVKEDNKTTKKSSKPKSKNNKKK